jgi:hypothetical protein
MKDKDLESLARADMDIFFGLGCICLVRIL